jgi:hypothetical protein
MQPTRAEVTPRAGAWIDADRLRGTIKNAGFKAGDIRLTLAGTLTEWHGQPALRVPIHGSERLIVLQPDRAAPDAFARAQQLLPTSDSKSLEVEGEYIDRAVAGDKTAPPALRVRRLEEKS